MDICVFVWVGVAPGLRYWNMAAICFGKIARLDARK
jgi:hypothetical protein